MEQNKQIMQQEKYIRLKGRVCMLDLCDTSRCRSHIYIDRITINLVYIGHITITWSLSVCIGQEVVICLFVGEVESGCDTFSFLPLFGHLLMPKSLYNKLQLSHIKATLSGSFYSVRCRPGHWGLLASSWGASFVFNEHGGDLDFGLFCPDGFKCSQFVQWNKERPLEWGPSSPPLT